MNKIIIIQIFTDRSKNTLPVHNQHLIPSRFRNYLLSLPFFLTKLLSLFNATGESSGEFLSLGLKK